MKELLTDTTGRPPGTSIENLAAVGIPGLQPVFFFDGGFRTWREVQVRADFNRAVAAQIPEYRLTPAA